MQCVDGRYPVKRLLQDYVSGMRTQVVADVVRITISGGPTPCFPSPWQGGKSRRLSHNFLPYPPTHQVETMHLTVFMVQVGMTRGVVGDFSRRCHKVENCSADAQYADPPFVWPASSTGTLTTSLGAVFHSLVPTPTSVSRIP